MLFKLYQICHALGLTSLESYIIDGLTRGNLFISPSNELLLDIANHGSKGARYQILYRFYPGDMDKIRELHALGWDEAKMYVVMEKQEKGHEEHFKMVNRIDRIKRILDQHGWEEGRKIILGLREEE